MRTGGRLAAAIEVLTDIQTRHRPAADALKDWGLSHRFAGAGDRGAIGNIVYDALRRRRSAAHLFGSDTPRALAFGALLLEWGETAASLNAALEGDRFAPPGLDETEIAAIAAHPLETAPDAVRADVPDWCAPMLERAFGEGWVEEGRALSARPPLDLRVNTLRADRERVLRELSGTKAAPTALAPHGIRIPPIEGSGRHPNVQAEPAFAKGWMEVQDEGSQIAARLAGAEPGMQVLDYCAGAGGKTLALSADMDNRGQLFAHDAEKQRLAPIFDRLRRSETRNVQVVARPDELAPLEGRMDLVLVDAPCTGSGTWRRRPDAKWRLTERQLEVRMAEQEAILSAAARYVRPGGRLVYVTCSLFEQENAERLRSFLAGRADFAAVDHAALFEASFPGRTGLARIDRENGISLTPARSGTDGFYVGVTQRQE
ncbi:RsmB/NOP family class I SAM-dependent RNA methyltransferase [Aquibium carbonis]|uniref:RsmB/NOP family class I SAM-dependent RNA methyltransferase n=1 Tax=Aquibium carbonis TaxID=2495581 RepID=A0A3S0A5M1_9HYPH|nr:RsmB/NOP family class I SAM-dependent RNA methyltransferase [Aquibium carbonis]RST85304.1 RsmB/NOP family class I SAM-dependent RNA methyltransferase [Aquibium carbonis]